MDASLQKNSRLGWLDFGKAMGILVVLLVHAECKLGPITYYGGMFYMPIFFVAAGYTYRYKKEIPFAAFVKKKARRLLLPYFGTSAFLWLFFWLKDSVFGGNPMDLKLRSLMGILYSRNQMYAAGYAGENPVLLDLLNAPLWFLTAMFLTYVYYELISRSDKKYIWLAFGFLASSVWHVATELLLPWSLDAVPYFACFMAVGEMFREKDWRAHLSEKRSRVLVYAIVFFVCANFNGSVNLSCGQYGNMMAMYLVVGSLGSLLVFWIGTLLERFCKPMIKVSSLIGQETLTILCWHMFLFMFIKVGSGIVGLGSGLTKVCLVVGSLILLTVFGKITKRIKWKTPQS